MLSTSTKHSLCPPTSKWPFPSARIHRASVEELTFPAIPTHPRTLHDILATIFIPNYTRAKSCNTSCSDYLSYRPSFSNSVPTHHVSQPFRTFLLDIVWKPIYPKHKFSCAFYCPYVSLRSGILSAHFLVFTKWTSSGDQPYQFEVFRQYSRSWDLM